MEIKVKSRLTFFILIMPLLPIHGLNFSMERYRRKNTNQGIGIEKSIENKSLPLALSEFQAPR